MGPPGSGGTKGMPAVAAQTSPLEIVEVTENGVPELSAFVARQSHLDAGEVEAHLRWFLLRNPARDSSTPLGWELRSRDGELAGCFLCVPQAFRFRETTFVLMGSSTFYVDAAHRGAGGMLFLKYSRLSSKWPLFGTSANPESGRLWKARGAVPIPDTGHELLGVLNWRPVIEEMSVRRGAGLGLSQWFAGLSSPGLNLARRLRSDRREWADLVPLTSSDQVMDLGLSAAPESLSAVRDRQYIEWRYFQRKGRAEVFAVRGKAGDTLLAVNRQARGYRNQIRALNVLDVYPRASPEVCSLIASLLVERYHGQADMIVFRGQNQAQQDSLRRLGFLRREFEAPCGWMLDKSRLLPASDWYLVPADGDWIL